MSLSDSVRETVLELDDYKCRFCEMTQEKHKDEHDQGLHVHHIIKDRIGGKDNPNNLITVCKDCHNLIEKTQADAIERLQNSEHSGNTDKLKREKQELKEKVESMHAQHDKQVKKTALLEDALASVLSSTIGVRVDVTHETNFNTSNILYIGADQERAIEEYKNSDNHATMESTNVVTTVIEQFNPDVSDKALKKLFDEVLEGDKQTPYVKDRISGVLKGELKDEL